jgi:penicillin-binding protein 1A
MRDSSALVRSCAAALVVSAATPVFVSVVVLLSLLYLPPPARLPDPRPTAGGQVTRVYDVNGDEIGQFREFEQNLPIRQADIPLVLKHAVVAAEDKNFYSHGGLDMRGIVRALSADLQGHEIKQGGSTITQQYVKNAYTNKERTVGRKVREAILASQIDRKIDKNEILFKYLSTIYFGEGAYGAGAASGTYFRKPVSQLTLSEAAVLAGVIPAPSRFEPRGNRLVAEDRRVTVLDEMLDHGFITTQQHDEAIRERIFIAGNAPPGPATLVYPAEQPVTRYPYFLDYVRRYLIAKYGPSTVFRGGLQVYTTLDPVVQAAAEKAVAGSLDGTSPPLEMALTAVEPPTGYVKAMVGGRDFNAAGGQVNLALGSCTHPPDKLKDKVDVPATCWGHDTVTVEGGGTGRQPGSSWKPFVLAAALAKGIPDTKVYSAPGTYHIPGCRGANGCTIQNYEGSAGGRVTLRVATAKSFNTVYAQVIQDVGVPEVAKMAKRLGITSAWVANPEIHGISYALGVQEVAPLEMASAYGVFADRGLRAEPTPVVYIKDPAGKFLEDNRKRQPVRVLDENIAYNVTDVLKGVITSGTGRAADIGRPAAGKTGTAEEYRDAWFIGYTPTLSAAVWIGTKDRPTPLVNIKGVSRVAGGTIPAATWKAFMSEALKDVPVTDFAEPPPPPPTIPPTTVPPSFVPGSLPPFTVPPGPVTTLPEPPTTRYTIETTPPPPDYTTTTVNGVAPPTAETTAPSPFR